MIFHVISPATPFGLRAMPSLGNLTDEFRGAGLAECSDEVSVGDLDGDGLGKVLTAR